MCINLKQSPCSKYYVYVYCCIIECWGSLPSEMLTTVMFTTCLWQVRHIFMYILGQNVFSYIESMSAAGKRSNTVCKTDWDFLWAFSHMQMKEVVNSIFLYVIMKYSYFAVTLKKLLNVVKEVFLQDKITYLNWFEKKRIKNMFCLFCLNWIYFLAIVWVVVMAVCETFVV